MITLEVYLEENQNKNHPNAGWYVTGKFSTVKEAAECYDRAKTIRGRANMPDMAQHRIVITDNEDIERQLSSETNFSS